VKANAAIRPREFPQIHISRLLTLQSRGDCNAEAR
jgi:hypothetical protein